MAQKFGDTKINEGLTFTSLHSLIKKKWKTRNSTSIILIQIDRVNGNGQYAYIWWATYVTRSLTLHFTSHFITFYDEVFRVFCVEISGVKIFTHKKNAAQFSGIFQPLFYAFLLLFIALIWFALLTLSLLSLFSY